MKTLLLLLAFATFPVSAQFGYEPVKGDISDLKGKTVFFIIANEVDAERIRPRFKKGFTQTDMPDEADFLIEYIVDRIEYPDMGAGLPRGARTETGTLNIFYYRDDGRKVLVWTDSYRAYGHRPLRYLSTKAAKALRKL